MTDIDDQTLKNVEERSDEPTAEVWRTSIVLIVVSIAAAFGGMAIALVVSAKGITDPFSLLARPMGEPADGCTDMPVKGTDRCDEVGSIAPAVGVSKEAAIEQRSAEAAKEIKNLIQASGARPPVPGPATAARARRAAPPPRSPRCASPPGPPPHPNPLTTTGRNSER